jgi:hypothetical protein
MNTCNPETEGAKEGNSNNDILNDEDDEDSRDSNESRDPDSRDSY